MSTMFLAADSLWRVKVSVSRSGFLSHKLVVKALLLHDTCITPEVI